MQLWQRFVARAVTLALLSFAVAAAGSAASVRDVGEWARARDTGRLLLAVADPDPSVALAAKQALDELGDPLGSLVLSTIRGSGEARAALAERKDFRATAPLTYALANADPVYRMYVVQALGDLGDAAAVPALIAFIERQDVALRLAADRSQPYWALVRLRDPRALDVFVAGVQSGDPLVRVAAAWGLAAVMQPGAAQVALAGLHDANAEVRAACAWAFKRLPTPESVPALLRLLGDLASSVREAAAYALGAAGDPAARLPLRRALDDPAPEVRAGAAWAVGSLGDDASVEALFRLLGDSATRVREAAAGALEELGQPVGKQLLAALSGDEAARAALRAISDPRVVPPLVALANAREPAPHGAALSVLAGLGLPEARNALVDAAARWSPPARAAATWALLASPVTSPGDKALQLVRVAAHPSSLVYLGALAGLIVGLRLVLRRVRRRE